MLNRTVLFAAQFLPQLQEEGDEPFPWWLILLLLLFIICVVIWSLYRNARRTEVPLVEHKAVEAALEPAPLPEEVVRLAEPVPAALEAAAPVIPDDLKLIEGIGPKISGLLNAAGIFTFAQLANTPVAAIQEILDRVSLRIADPGTWPEQAALAAKGDLEGLQALQDSLKGGRRV